jgi:transcriptional regulator with XRE-family HTH domain
MRYQVRDLDELRKLLKTPVRLVPHTERSLADEVGVSKTLIGYLKSGERETVAEDVATRVANAYGRNIEDLFVPVPSTCMDGDGSEQ